MEAMSIYMSGGRHARKGQLYRPNTNRCRAQAPKTPLQCSAKRPHRLWGL